jgi:hypothetical protein
MDKGTKGGRRQSKSEQVGRHESQKDGIPRLVSRGVLVVLAVFLLWAGFIVHKHAAVQARATSTLPLWGSWLKWHGLYVIAGLSFGLAAALPRGVRYRLGRALLLGALPIVWLVHVGLVGPGVHFTVQHLGFVARWPSSADLAEFEWTMDAVAAAWLGLSIAAGFEQGK